MALLSPRTVMVNLFGTEGQKGSAHGQHQVPKREHFTSMRSAKCQERARHQVPKREHFTRAEFPFHTSERCPKRRYAMRNGLCFVNLCLELHCFL